MKKWYDNPAGNSDLVITSRIRLARNLEKYPFAERLDDARAAELVKALRTMTPVLEEKENLQYYSCNVNKLSDIERNSMVEWHIVSPMLAKKKQDTGLILSEDESVGIMLNEEDHMRIQSIASGMNMEEAYKAANRIDDYFEDRFEYAYSARYGYMTSCPTNLGTGMRASYMVFLPALTVSEKIDKLADEVQKYGVTIRGIYGEGTKSLGYMYQISNQRTLGRTERDIIENLDQIMSQIMAQERNRRNEIINANYNDIEDKVYRSYGVLKYAKSLTVKDAMILLAQLKFGADTGLVTFKSTEKARDKALTETSVKSAKEDVTQPINNRPRGTQTNLHLLMMEIQPASIQKQYGKHLNTAEQNRFRAEHISSRLPEV